MCVIDVCLLAILLGLFFFCVFLFTDLSITPTGTQRGVDSWFVARRSGRGEDGISQARIFATTQPGGFFLGRHRSRALGKCDAALAVADRC